MAARPLSFSRNKRLARAAEFRRVKEVGLTHRGRLLSLGVKSDPGTFGFRAGFITSKRIGGAVIRNRVRRRMREVVRRQQVRLCGGIWFVVIAGPAAAHASYQALEDEWLRLAKRASILAP